MKLKNVLPIMAVLFVGLIIGCDKNDVPEVDPSNLSPLVISTSPLNKAENIATNRSITVNFNAPMDPSSITTTTFTLKEDTANVSGMVGCVGATATFTPIGNMQPNKIYTVMISSEAKDMNGNGLAENFTCSFTTGGMQDISIPTVISTDPLNNASGVELNKVIAITFSEAMNPLTISASTFILKQGATAISGSVAFSGTTATFTPTVILDEGLVYTAMINTNAKDLAGNSLAANSTLNFTTRAAAVVGQSFANDVIPVLNMCENCHSHQWTPSSVATTYYTNLLITGYVNPSSYTTSKIYKKLSSGHPGSGNISTANTDKIINWMKEGSKNN